MANTILFETRVANRHQDVLKKVSVADAITDTSLEAKLTSGATIARDILDLTNAQIRAEVRTNTDRTIDDMTETQETLVVDKAYYHSNFIHDFDKIQSNKNLPEKIGSDLAIAMGSFYDGTVLNETKNAFDSLDDGDIAGTVGNGITLATTNVALVATNGAAKLRANKVPEMNFAWVVDPYMTAVVEQTLMAKSTDMGDSAFANNYVGKMTRNMSVYESNSLTFTGKLTTSTNASANDTVTIGGVVFKFVASVGTTAGNVLIGADAAASTANLVAAINGASGAGTTYIELTAANRTTIRDTLRCTATDGTTFITIECIGSGRVTVSEALTHADNIWSLKKLRSYMGKKNSIHVVRQSLPGIKIMPNPKNPRISYLHIDSLWGQKTFNDGKQRFLDCQISVA